MYNHKLSISAGFAAFFGLVASSHGALLIDDFSIEQSVFGNGTDETAANGRGLGVNLTSGVAGLIVGGGNATFNRGSGGAYGIMNWDGIVGSRNTTTAFGPSGLDISQGGLNDAFSFVYSSSTTMDVRILAVEFNGIRYWDQTISLPASGGMTEATFSFADFSNIFGAPGGSPDFNNLGGLVLEIYPTSDNFSMAMDNFQAVSSISPVPELEDYGLIAGFGCFAVVVIRRKLQGNTPVTA